MSYHGLDHFVGNTPLIRLNRLSDLTGCEILGKAEFMNPGGSVKDRAALGIITRAENDGLLFPGGTIVEGTAGNTGIGLTIIGQARGYRTVIVIPETQSPEKISLLRALGAEVMPVPAKPYSDPRNYNHIARRLAVENGWFWADQFDNLANRQAHYDTTGPEILAQTHGSVNAFVSAVGTGGTLAGTSLFLKEKTPASRRCARIPTARPCGAGSLRTVLISMMAIPSPKASARAGSPITLRTSKWTRPTASTTTRRSRFSINCYTKKGFSSDFPVASTSVAPCATHRMRAPEKPSSPSFATPDRNTNPSSTTPSGSPKTIWCPHRI